jgi:hypothetical protein
MFAIQEFGFFSISRMVVFSPSGQIKAKWQNQCFLNPFRCE